MGEIERSRASLLEPISLLPDGIEWLRDPFAGDMRDDLETVRVYDRTTRRHEREQFTWTPFAITKYRRVGLFRWEPYRTYDYPALDARRREIGVSLVRRLLDARTPVADLSTPPKEPLR